MPLQEAELEQVGGYVRKHLEEWLTERPGTWTPETYEWDLRERMVRVEEELRHQRELMQQGFELMERRFEQVDKRFEQMEKRFEQVDKRFEQVDKRFEQIDRHFQEVTRRIDRFMVWSFGITVAAAGIVIGVLKAWP